MLLAASVVDDQTKSTTSSTAADAEAFREYQELSITDLFVIKNIVRSINPDRYYSIV